MRHCFRYDIRRILKFYESRSLFFLMHFAVNYKYVFAHYFAEVVCRFKKAYTGSPRTQYMNLEGVENIVKKLHYKESVGGNVPLT